MFDDNPIAEFFDNARTVGGAFEKFSEVTLILLPLLVATVAHN